MATKEDIVAALLKLDSGNDNHWTDDGAPRVDIVQQLTGDNDVRRKDINEASPGFSRAVPGATTEPEDVQDGDPQTVTVVGHADDEEGSNDFLGDALDDDELKALMQKRLADAERGIHAARAAVTDAQSNLRKAEGRHAKAMQDLYRRFPPLHPADAIKAHLESQLRQRYEQRTNMTPSQIDEAMGTRGKRGWGQSARRV